MITAAPQRAQAVAARLEAALGGTSIAAEGRGESEPLVAGTFELTMTAGSGTGLELMGKGVTDAGRRGFSLTDSIAGVMGVSLLTSDAMVYPLDYDMPLPDADTPARNVLGDELINMGMGDPGQSVHVTVAWPDTGADAVTIDIPGRGRFEDVPVME